MFKGFRDKGRLIDIKIRDPKTGESKVRTALQQLIDQEREYVDSWLKPTHV